MLQEPQSGSRPDPVLDYVLWLIAFEACEIGEANVIVLVTSATHCYLETVNVQRFLDGLL